VVHNEWSNNIRCRKLTGHLADTSVRGWSTGALARVIKSPIPPRRAIVHRRAQTDRPWRRKQIGIREIKARRSMPGFTYLQNIHRS